MKNNVIIVLIVLFMQVCKVYSQNSKWVVDSGVCSVANLLPEAAMKKSKEIAETEAVKSFVGVTVKENIYYKQSESSVNKNSEILDMFSKLNTSTSSGRIIEEKIISQNIYIDNNQPFCKTVIKALVAKDTIQNDPSFTAKIIMEKDVFYDRGNLRGNDVVSFKIWASQDCYIYLFNIMSNDTVQMLIPNSYLKDNFYSIQPNRSKLLEQIKKLTFSVQLPKDKEQTTEMLMLVAFKNKIDLSAINLNMDDNGIMASYNSAIVDIQKWLMNIRADLRTECTQIFEIRKYRQ